MKKEKNSWKKIKHGFKRSWDFIWKDESFLGWLVSLIIIFLIVKFVFFPVLSLITGSPLPLVVVESSSMSHDAAFLGDFDSWWEENYQWYEDYGFTKNQTLEWALRGGMEKGDIALIVAAANPQVGDVYLQEYYEGEAEDMAQVVALGVKIKVKYGSFSDCLQTLDWNPLEEDSEEHIKSLGRLLQKKLNPPAD